MDLELATTDDIVNELRSRRMRFVFIGATHTNINASGPIVVESQAVNHRDAFDLIKVGVEELQKLDDDRIELDYDG